MAAKRNNPLTALLGLTPAVRGVELEPWQASAQRVFKCGEARFDGLIAPDAYLPGMTPEEKARVDAEMNRPVAVEALAGYLADIQIPPDDIERVVAVYRECGLAGVHSRLLERSPE